MSEGNRLLRAGSLVEAADTFRAALDIDALHAVAIRHLAWTLELLGRRDDAVGAWCSLGKAFEDIDQFQAAVAAYHRALASKPTCLRAHLGKGCAHLALGEASQAAEHFQAVLTLAPDCGFAHVRLGWALHAQGYVPKAWSHFEWYHRGERRRLFEQPMWDGSPLRGRTILLWADLGLGDAVQCLRYIRRLKKAGARVIVECQPALLPLVRDLDGVDQAVSSGSPLPFFDMHAPFLSLHWLISAGTDCHQIGFPYVTAAATSVQAWSNRLRRENNRARIGIVWASNRSRPQASRLKSVPLSLFIPLLKLNVFRFYSLQIGPATADLDLLPPDIRIERPLCEMSTLADTMAVMMNMDLVITVDTLAAHLAGALARPTWVLAPQGAAWWLWHKQGDRSLWYPTMRLFQQSTQDHWSDVIRRVAYELPCLIK